MLVYKVDFNITIIDYKDAIVAILNKSSHTIHHKQLASSTCN